MYVTLMQGFLTCGPGPKIGLHAVYDGSP